jgi:hypothetical protein
MLPLSILLSERELRKSRVVPSPKSENKKKKKPLFCYGYKEPLFACSFCYRPVAVSHCCAHCKIAKYCSTECQQQNWKAHRPVCLSIGPKTKLAAEARLVASSLFLTRLLAAFEITLRTKCQLQKRDISDYGYVTVVPLDPPARFPRFSPAARGLCLFQENGYSRSDAKIPQLPDHIYYTILVIERKPNRNRSFIPHMQLLSFGHRETDEFDRALQQWLSDQLSPLSPSSVHERLVIYDPNLNPKSMNVIDKIKIYRRKPLYRLKNMEVD